MDQNGCIMLYTSPTLEDFDQTNWFEKIEPRQVKDSRRASATASAGLASSASCVWRHRGRGELEIGLGQFH